MKQTDTETCQPRPAPCSAFYMQAALRESLGETSDIMLQLQTGTPILNMQHAKKHWNSSNTKYYEWKKYVTMHATSQL